MSKSLNGSSPSTTTTANSPNTVTIANAGAIATTNASAGSDQQSSSTTAKLELENSNAFERALDSEYNLLGETVKSYVIFAIALSTLIAVQAQFGFFYVLCIFAVIFIASAYIKAYVNVLKTTQRGNTNRTLLANVAMLADLSLGFVTILLVQVIMARVTPFFSDGHFKWESLVLPFVLFALLFGEWYARRARTAAEIDKID